MIIENLISYLYIVPAALLAIIFHEFAHGLVSTWLGDPTPKATGRLTLNPVKHLDIVGLICLVFFHFGWAKPVLIDPSYYKNKKVGITLVSLAGPVMNFLLMLFSFIVLGIIYIIICKTNIEINLLLEILINFFSYFAILNIGLGVFNLIPIPPLDGSKIVGIVLPKDAYEEYMGYQKYGSFFMIGIMVVIYILSLYNVESPISSITMYIYKFFIYLIEKIFYLI